jgi:hypothetical protein
MQVGQQPPSELSESQASRALARKRVLRSLCTGHGDFRFVEARVVEPDEPARTVREAHGTPRRRLRLVKVAQHASARARKVRRSR